MKKKVVHLGYQRKGTFVHGSSAICSSESGGILLIMGEFPMGSKYMPSLLDYQEFQRSSLRHKHSTICPFCIEQLSFYLEHGQ